GRRKHRREYGLQARPLPRRPTCRLLDDRFHGVVFTRVEEPIAGAAVEVLDLLVGGPDRGEALRVLFGRELTCQIEITPADRLVAGVARHAENSVWVGHG